MNRVLTATGAFRAWWSVAMVLVTAVAVGVVCIVYTDQQQRRADRRWCPLLATLDQPSVPATTERGRAVQQQIHQLRTETGCEVR